MTEPNTTKAGARTQIQTMAIDQYGQTYHGLGEHPRKALLERLGSKHADKMYVDTKDGQAKHVGYIINGLWLSVYTVTPWGIDRCTNPV